MRPIQKLCLAAAAATLIITVPVRGQCPMEDFEGFAVGTPITNQIEGVQFFAVGGACPVTPLIVDPPGGTSSGTRALGLPAACPDFSVALLYMQFDELQPYVSFMVGDQASIGIPLQVVGYDAGFDIMYNETFVCGEGVHRKVEIGSLGGDPEIRRIAVYAHGDLFEAIDDLVFNVDTTPPTGRIDFPRSGDCFCGPSVYVTGVACDEDGGHAYDKLEYRRAGTDDPWTHVQTFTTPVCEPGGNLYTWNISTLPHGRYYLKQTVENECGLVTTDVRWVLVDKNFGETEVVSPTPGESVCGAVEIEGSAHDGCYTCFVEYTVGYATSPNGPFIPVDPAKPTYDDIVINGKLATWDVTDLTDGMYYLRVLGTDECGNVDVTDTWVDVDQAGGCGDCAADGDGNGVVNVDDLVRVISQWGPCAP